MPYLVLFSALFLIGLASHFISTAVYRRMQPSNSRKVAVGVRVGVFVVSFLIIFATVGYLILANIRIER